MGVNSYTCADEIRRRYPRLFETAGFTAGEVEAMVDDVDLQIDGMLGARYAIPFALPAPPLVRSIARDLVSYRLLRSQIIGEQPSTSDWVEKLQEKASEFLTMLAQGSLDLASGSGTVIDPTASNADRPWSSTRDYVPTFGVLPMTAQRVDPDRVEVEEDARET